MDAPDLTLRGVAFARLSEGRVLSRGTAARLDYRRAGGRLQASQGTLVLEPQPGTGLAPLGTLALSAREIEGEVQARRGTAQGDVTLDSRRGDHAATERVAFDGTVARSTTPVTAHGPGYRVAGGALVAAADGSSIELTHGVRGNLDLEAGK